MQTYILHSALQLISSIRQRRHWLNTASTPQQSNFLFCLLAFWLSILYSLPITAYVVIVVDSHRPGKIDLAGTELHL